MNSKSFFSDIIISSFRIFNFYLFVYIPYFWFFSSALITLQNTLEKCPYLVILLFLFYQFHFIDFYDCMDEPKDITLGDMNLILLCCPLCGIWKSSSQRQRAKWCFVGQNRWRNGKTLVKEHNISIWWWVINYFQK